MLFIDRKACRDRQELLRHEDEKREKNSNRKSFVGFNILFEYFRNFECDFLTLSAEL